MTAVVSGANGAKSQLTAVHAHRYPGTLAASSQVDFEGSIVSTLGAGRVRGSHPSDAGFQHGSGCAGAGHRRRRH